MALAAQPMLLSIILLLCIEARSAGPLPITLGVVEYCDTVGKIWEGMSSYYLNQHDIDLKVKLFDNYDSMTLDLLAQKIDIAWNGPIAHVNVIKLAQAHGMGPVISLGMRDVDRDMESVIIARRSWAEEHGLAPPEPLSVESDGGTSKTQANEQDHRGLLSTAAGPATAARAAVEAAARAGRLVSGAIDSPQGFLAPLFHLSQTLGFKVDREDVRSFNVDLGKHGDTAVGEVQAMDELMAGRADVAMVSDVSFARLQARLKGESGSHAPASSDPPSSGKGKEKVELVVIEGNIFLDHCRFDALEQRVPKEVGERFSAALLAMDMANEEERKTMLEEGIRKSWLPARLARDAEMAAQMKLGGIKVPLFSTGDDAKDEL